ncbi:uncharacterized protein LOC141617591 [Silene latifolia]|uniref:uncharacterized protein LOC141617591 n=1 Tax=Silene latifolia TaxID=37657 RepID=UPI003D785494
MSSLLGIFGSLTVCDRQKAIDPLLTCTTKGKFSVGKAYNLLRPKFPTQACYRAVQDPFLQSRHKFTLMLALQRKLATVDQLCRRGISIANRCCLCKKNAESSRHLFFNCPYSQTVLSSLLSWMGLNLRDLQLRSLILWCHRSKPKQHWRNKWFKCGIAAATYYIWMERNYRLFEGKERQAPCLIKDIKLCVHVLLLHKSSPTEHTAILEALNV